MSDAFVVKLWIDNLDSASAIFKSIHFCLKVFQPHGSQFHIRLNKRSFVSIPLSDAETMQAHPSLAPWSRMIADNVIDNWSLYCHGSIGPQQCEFELLRDGWNFILHLSCNSSSYNADAFASYCNSAKDFFSAISIESALRTGESNNSLLQSDLISRLVKSSAESTAQIQTSLKDGISTLISKTVEANESLKSQALEYKRELDLEREQARKDLDEERKAFEAERKAFNDKESTLVRRDLLDKIQSILAKNDHQFELSPKTEQMKRPIYIIYAILMILSLLFASFSLYTFALGSEKDFLILIPFSLSMSLFVTTAFLFLRWQNNWSKRHAEMEIRNQILHQDMMRASWFAELMFEYKDDDGRLKPVPDSVVQVMTKNLFRDQSQPDVTASPAEDVAAFLSRLTKVHLAKDGVELESDRKKK